MAMRVDFPLILRWSDQVCCVGLIATSLLVMGICWVYQGGLRGRLIDVDRAPRRPMPFQLDIQTATWQEWSVLPRIGEQLAKRIVESRERDGPFRSIEDLLRVPGIGPKTLDRLRPFLKDDAQTAVAGVEQAGLSN